MIALVGKTASGKSTIASELAKLGIERVVTYTTRKRRRNEKDGVDYHFVTDEEFDRMYQEQKFAETTSFTMADGITVHYGTLLSDLVGDKCIIVNPEGLDKLRKIKDVNLTTFLIETEPKTTWNRLLARGDSLNEAARRVAADNRDFEGLKYDHIIVNNNDCDPKMLAATIMVYYKVGKDTLR